MRFIEAHNLTKVYGTGDNAFYALNDVSFSIDKGCFVAVTAVSQQLGMTLPSSVLLILRDVQKSKGRFFITVFAIMVSVAMFTSFAGAAVTVTDFMGSYIDKSGMDFYFASSHHVDKTPESYAALRQDLSQYTAITGM